MLNLKNVPPRPSRFFRVVLIQKLQYMDGSIPGFFNMLTSLCNAYLGISKEFPHREILLHKIVKLTYKFTPDLANSHGNTPGPVNEIPSEKTRQAAKKTRQAALDLPSNLKPVVAPFEIKVRCAQPVIGFGSANAGKLNPAVWSMVMDATDIYERADQTFQESSKLKFSVEFRHNGKAWKLAALPTRVMTQQAWPTNCDLVVQRVAIHRVKSVSFKLPASLGVIPAFPSMIKESNSTNSAIIQTIRI